MSLDNLPESRDEQHLYARIAVLWKTLNIASYDAPPLNWGRLSKETISKELEGLAEFQSLSDTQLLEWIKKPKAKTWGLLFRLCSEYLKLKGLITEIETPLAPQYRIGNPPIDSIRNPQITEEIAFKIVKKKLELWEEKQIKLPHLIHLKPIDQMARLILIEVEAKCKKSGRTLELQTVKDDMTNLANAIQKTLENIDPQYLLNWYHHPNSPTWGHIYQQVGAYLKEFDQIQEINKPIPAVKHEAERGMFHSIVRNPTINQQLLKIQFSQRAHDHQKPGRTHIT